MTKRQLDASVCGPRKVQSQPETPRQRALNAVRRYRGCPPAPEYRGCWSGRCECDDLTRIVAEELAA